MNEKQKVIDIALAEVGYHEKSSNSNLDDKTANTGTKNYTKYARDLDSISGFYNGKKNGYDWCDVFVDWCFVKAVGVERALELLNQPKKSTGAGCGFSMNFYKSKGQLFDKPQSGDQIFFTDGSSICHTGLVYAVDNSRVYTVEGNTLGGQVAKKSYSLNDKGIAGYGRPKYCSSEEVKEEKQQNTTSAPKTVLEWQKIMNKVYGCGLAEDNSFGPDSKSKANKYYLHYKIPTIKNDHVKFIQEQLCRHGYRVEVDRSFGPDCEAKIKQFQKDHGLTVDGYVGAKTTELLLKL